MADLFEILVRETSQFFKQNNYSRACMALSGDVHTSVVAVIAGAALGSTMVKAVMMPGLGDPAGSLERAEEVATSLRISWISLPVKFLTSQIERELAGGGDRAGELTHLILPKIRSLLLVSLGEKSDLGLLSSKDSNELSGKELWVKTPAKPRTFCPLGSLKMEEVQNFAVSLSKSYPVLHTVLEKPRFSVDALDGFTGFQVAKLVV